MNIKVLKKQIITSSSLTKDRLIELVTKISKARVLVLGDLILDEYLIAKPERISREAPVIIFKYLESNFKLGGAANAAANLASLGIQTTLIGLSGDDTSASSIETICSAQGIKLINIRDSQRQTTTKTRIISNSSANLDTATGVQQQVLRVDKEDDRQISADHEKQINQVFKSELANNDLVLLSDYSNGVLSNSLSKQVVDICNKNKKKSIVDSNGDLIKFKGAYSFTPNQPDVEALLEIKIANDQELEQAGTLLRERLEAKELLITRGAKGMALFGDASLDLIPAFNLSEVFDVSGAGDTVSALYSAALAIAASPLEAAILGNLAASIVVKKYGTATTCKEELLQLIEAL